MPEAIEELSETAQRLAEERAKQLDDEIDAFVALLAAILEAWEEHIHSLIESLPSEHGASYLTDFQYLKNQIEAFLYRQRYGYHVDELIAQYGEGTISAQLLAAAIELDEIGPVDPDALRALKEIDREKLKRDGSVTSQLIAETILGAVILGLSYGAIKEQVKRRLDEFEALASLHAETGLLAADRYVSWAVLGSARQFLYFGPDDDRCRPFCKQRVGKTYTKSEIDKMKNGQIEPVSVYMGGYRCRHLWVPVGGDKTT